MALLGAGIAAQETIQELDPGDSQGNKKTRINKTRNFKTIMGLRVGKIILEEAPVLATRVKKALEKVPDLEAQGKII